MWLRGPVTWLGLPVTPDVTFEHGAAAGSININITIGMPPFGKTITLPASVNAAGELVVDTTNVPDLSELGLGGRLGRSQADGLSLFVGD